MIASFFDRYLMNFIEQLPANWSYYLPKDEAYEKLKQLSGRDFGEDIEAWIHWARENRLTICYKNAFPRPAQTPEEESEFDGNCET